jgi:hypothetical protein
MGIIWTIIIAKFLMPGDNEPSGFILRQYLASSARLWRRFLGRLSAGIGPAKAPA